MKPRLTAAAFAVGLAFSMPSYADSSSASVYQSGTGNVGSVDQQSSDGSFAYVNQVGNNNHGVYDAYGYSTINEAFATNSFAGVDQTGNSNQAVIFQGYLNFGSSYVGQYGNGNTGYVSQFGSDNGVAWVFQGGFACYDRNCESIDFSLPASQGSYASIGQYGPDNTALIIQSGQYHGASIYQVWGGGNTARIIQADSSNSAYVQQGGTAYIWNPDTQQYDITDMGASTKSEAYVNQSGSYQYAQAYQGGNGNAVSSYQYGTNDELTVLQVGNNNSVYNYQTGTGGSWDDRNVAKVTQTGNSLSASVSQYGMANNARITQH